MPESHESSTKADVETRLHGTAETIQQRIEAIQEEVASARPTIRKFLREHPLMSVGGSLLAGVVLGWLLGGKRKPSLSKSHRRLLQHYIEGLRDEVRDAVASGAEVGEAMQDALRNRAPLIVYSEDEEGSEGILLQGLRVAIGAAFPLLVRQLLTAYLEPPESSDLDYGEGDTHSDGLSVGDESSAS